jgi:spermidine/putrescine transport system substrate-binding protein
MRRTLALVSLLLVPLAACAPRVEEAPPAPAAAGPCELNLFIWSEYIDPEIISDFESQFGCKVTVDLYEDNESMLAKLQGGGTSLYDVVVPSQYVIPVMANLGVLAPLRHENIPNLANLEEKFRSPVYDPGNRYSVAYQWGTVGIYLRRPAGQAVDESWAVLFEPGKDPGPFLLMDSVREMLGSALRYQGKSVNTTSPEEIKAAAAILADAKKRSQGFEGGVGGKNKVLGRAVAAAVVYNGDAVRGTADDPETYYFVPREGSTIWVDSLAVPAQAPHRDAAEQFINYILDPQVGARLSNFNQYATPNKAAKPFINPEDLANPAIYPPSEVMEGLEFIVDLGDENRLYDEAWTQVKSE